MKFGSKDKGKTKSGFTYKPRDEEKMQQRATRRIGSGESYFSENVKMFFPREGDHEIRILPPTWEDASHFGIDLWLHHGIGPDQSSYLCPQKMNNEPCPLCEERIKAQKEGEDDLAAALQPRPRVAFYLINRRSPKDGPVVWSAPARTEKEICAQAHDKKTRSFVNLDDPSDEGYDISFTVEGTGIQTRYTTIKVDRSSSPLSDDDAQAEEWLKQIEEHPLPDELIIQDYDHLKEALEGGVRTKDDDKDKDKEKERKAGGSGRRDEKGKGRERFPEDQKDRFNLDDLTWEEVHDLSEKDTELLAEQAEIDEKHFESCRDLEEVQDTICDLLRIKKPKDEKEGKGETTASRLAALRNKRK